MCVCVCASTANASSPSGLSQADSLRWVTAYASASQYPLKIEVEARLQLLSKINGAHEHPRKNFECRRECVASPRSLRRRTWTPASVAHRGDTRTRTCACRGIPPETMVDVRKHIRRRFCPPIGFTLQRRWLIVAVSLTADSRESSSKACQVKSYLLSLFEKQAQCSAKCCSYSF